MSREKNYDSIISTNPWYIAAISEHSWYTIYAYSGRRRAEAEWNYADGTVWLQNVCCKKRKIVTRTNTVKKQPLTSTRYEISYIWVEKIAIVFLNSNQYSYLYSEVLILD